MGRNKNRMNKDTGLAAEPVDDVKQPIRMHNIFHFLQQTNIPDVFRVGFIPHAVHNWNTPDKQIINLHGKQYCMCEDFKTDIRESNRNKNKTNLTNVSQKWKSSKWRCVFQETLSGQSLFFKDVKTVLTAAGVQLFCVAHLTRRLKNRQVILQWMTQVITVTAAQRVKGQTPSLVIQHGSVFIIFIWLQSPWFVCH